jgi:hypothetical protein
MADKKVSQLPEVTQVSSDDLLLVVNDPSGNPSSNKVTANNLIGNVRIDSTFHKNTTLSGNVNINCTTLTISANTTLKDGRDVLTEISDRIQVANADAKYATVGQLLQRMTEPQVVKLLTTNNDINYTANTITIQENKGLILKAGGLASNVVPATSNAQIEGYPSGSIWYSNNYLYIATDSVTIKRVALSTF